MKKTRIVKKNTERRDEILDIAQEFFLTKSYSKTTVEDVINKAGIAKGTFYHYFKSKEDLLDAIVMRFIETGVAIIESIVNDPKLTAEQKLYKITTFKYCKTTPRRIEIDGIRKADNARMYQKSLVQTVIIITPLITKVLEQGIKEGSFEIDHPYEAAEVMMVLSQFLFEDHILPWKPKEIPHKSEAYTKIIEDLFGAKRGVLSYMAKTQSRLLKGSKG
jgi:AcrR family transcriptional regulator